MADRRRVNGPTATDLVLKTGLTPSASGSAYLEYEPSLGQIEGPAHLSDRPPVLKLTCTVHGPRPLTRSAPFTPQLLLSAHIKYAPFASRQRKGYVRDANERDLAVHLESALRGVLIGERWPKSGVDIVITVLEGEEDYLEDDPFASAGSEYSQRKGLGMMSILSGCITVASAAIVDAGIDCVDFVIGGVAAIARPPLTNKRKAKSRVKSGYSEFGDQILMDPCPAEHEGLDAFCVVGYLQSRDEVTELWVQSNSSNRGDLENPEQTALDALTDRAVEAAMAARRVIVEAFKESTKLKIQSHSLDQV
ncbi:MAG: hypothetical protein Q9195_003741 [Heterodermia aff. obscurata]